MKRVTTSMVLVAAVGLLLVAAPAVFVGARFTDYTDIRNLSGETITDVMLQLHDHQTDWAITKRIATLKPGESLRVRHWHHDTRAVVEFVIAGQKFRHEEASIDLWSGEGWRFDIQPSGTVSSGYVHRHR